MGFSIINSSDQAWIAVIVALGTLLLLYICTGRNRRIQKHVDKLNGPLSFPIIGSGLWFIRPNYEIPELLINWYKKYGPVFRFWMGTEANVVLSGTPEIEKILTSNVHIEKSTDYRWFHKWLGLGLLTANRDKWHPRRKLLTPAFHFKILEQFVPIFNEQANVLVEVLKNEKCDSDDFFDIFPFITRCALDIICETAMGTQLNAQRAESELEYVKIIYGYGDILLRRFLRPWLQIEWIWKILGYKALEDKYLKELHGFTENVIATRKAERIESKALYKDDSEKSSEDDAFSTKKRKAFLDLLLDLSEGENPLSDLEIRNETDTFMFEGHDTTAASMVWTIFLLSLNPECQVKIQKELDTIFDGDRSSREITAADVSKMKYLECCVKEALRLYPSVAFFIRHLREDFDIGMDRLLPKGTNVWVGPLLVHRDPLIYPNPEEYNPERFLPENSIGRNPFAFIPFSAGPRNCIGQKFAFLEEKIVLAKLMLNFNFKSKVQSRNEVKMLPDIILRPFGGIYVKLVSRG